MTTLVNKQMLEIKVATDVTLVGDVLTFTYTDGSTQQLNIGTIPAIAQVGALVTKIAAINAYMAAHP